MNIRQTIIGLLNRHPSVLVSQNEYDTFFASPMWTAIKHEVANGLEVYYRTLLDPRCGIDAVNAARGAIKAIEWILDAEAWLDKRITNDREKLNANMPVEARLRELITMMETDHGS